LPRPSTNRPPELAWRSQACAARTVGLRGKATATDGVSSTRSVASAAKASGANGSCPSSTVATTSNPAASASRAAWAASRQCRSGSIVKTRMARSAPCQSPFDERQPVLAPEYLLTNDIARRTEHASIQRLLRIRMPPLAPARIGTELEHGIGFETDISDQGGHRRRIGGVLLILPDRLQHAMGKLDCRLVTHGFPQTDDACGGHLLIGREVLRLDSDRDTKVIAPALQFYQPIRLPLRRTPWQWQPARSRKDGAEVNRKDAQARSVRHRHRLDPSGAQVDPGRVERGIVVDVQGHGRFPFEPDTDSDGAPALAQAYPAEVE